jgi:hypothetical protein
MSELDQWQEKNGEYLTAALAWLRLCLARLPEMSSPETPPENIAEDKPVSWLRVRKQFPEVTAPAATEAAPDEIAKAAQAMAAAARIDPPPALLILGRRLGLSEYENRILLLCAAMELDTRIPSLCAKAQDHPDRVYPTFALALALFDNPSWEAVSAEGALRSWRLIEINQPASCPLMLSPLRADERIVSYIRGLSQLDDRLTPFISPFDVPEDTEPNLAGSHLAVAETIEQSLRQWIPGNRSPVVQLTGSDLLSKQQVVHHILLRLGLRGYRMPAELLPAAAGELETLARLWHRESVLLPLALYLDAADFEEGSRPAESQNLINRFVARCGTLTFLDTREPRAGLGIGALSFEIDKPLPAEQRDAWNEELGEAAEQNPVLLAGQFNLNLPAIRQIARSVLSNKPAEETAMQFQARLWDACRSRLRPRLDRLAQCIEAKATWKDLILPNEALLLLHEISDQVRQRSHVYDSWGFRRIMSRGFGISALFAGESGTGKTMAAEVIANDLQLTLYRIDLSAVVNKYIGETEKNLRRVFDAAEEVGVVLFFDEADALFGKRSEVKDSHDRYANIEINYLLQRMEAFRGLAILATNMKSALDKAFIRRLRFIVNFPFPGSAERKRIWEGVFPADDEKCRLPSTPLDAVDYDQLARLNLTGGSIHNIALNAAFLAARAGTAVTMPLIFEAARTEFRKLEKPVNEGDFRFTKPGGTPA